MTSFAEYQPDIFTSAELAMIGLICQQYFDAEIAKELSIGVRTVHAMRKSIMSKMKVKGPVGIVIYAVKHNIYHV